MGDGYWLVEVVRISDQWNERRQGFWPEGTYPAYTLSIVLPYKNTGSVGAGYLKGN